MSTFKCMSIISLNVFLYLCQVHGLTNIFRKTPFKKMLLPLLNTSKTLFFSSSSIKEYLVYVLITALFLPDFAA